MRPSTVVFRLLGVACAALAIANVAATALQQPRQRTIQVSVLGRGDAPVENLTERDFTVREDGQAREIVRVQPAPPPATIALLVDDSQVTAPLLNDLRRALTGFADLMADQSPAPAIRLTTFGDRPTVVTDFNASFSAVSRGIDTIRARPGAGAMFLEALVETCRDLRTRKLTGAVLVAFVAEDGPEFSTTRARAVADALKSAQASLWTVTLQARGGGPPDGDEERERATVLGDVTVESGGRNTVILAGQNLPPALERLATTILSRYEITYGRPESLVPPSKLEVTGRDRSWRIAASRWAAE